MYIEASVPRVAGDKARIISRPYYQFAATGGGYECIRFYYHMFGESVGTLRLYRTESDGDGTLGEPMFEKIGNQGNGWRVTQVKLF